ncbi:zinc-ribbon domain-containing protein [Roseivivax sediminis]|uniref:MJ0042 family finger-like domain-containing protein n=1 Tax=Roseivivax sediminis TaxID=936889 RepID=A0A1I1ZJ60_9RHOB|nr:zinc-ribbon domain-containing protein [Roseivivax sediminis]SFE31652.1 MJ0042 family finger-like domain-containing protein [Roseivivax sediminis]
MRLICPNCEAQYEVPVEVIPTGGREVQCSDCGHTWYQRHPGDPAPESAGDAAPQTDSDAAPTPDPEAERDEPAADAPSEPETLPDATETPPHPARRRELDPEVADVLRQEAEFEARHRAAEAGVIETQTEFGLDDPPEDESTRRARQARERMTRMRAEPTDAAERARRAAASTGAVGPARYDDPGTPAPDREGASRRDLLPDVDEINQTLRSSEDRRPVETTQGRAPQADDAGGGFGRGFVSVLLLGAALIALYAFAPRIADAVPALADPLAAYAAALDAARLWLDSQVTSVLVWLDTLGAGAGSAEG